MSCTGEVPHSEGSSTESMSHMREAEGGVSSSVEGYTDKVVDQYVLIEASPPTGSLNREEPEVSSHVFTSVVSLYM